MYSGPYPSAPAPIKAVGNGEAASAAAEEAECPEKKLETLRNARRARWQFAISAH